MLSLLGSCPSKHFLHVLASSHFSQLSRHSTTVTHTSLNTSIYMQHLYSIKVLVIYFNLCEYTHFNSVIKYIIITIIRQVLSALADKPRCSVIKITLMHRHCHYGKVKSSSCSSTGTAAEATLRYSRQEVMPNDLIAWLIGYNDFMYRNPRS